MKVASLKSLNCISYALGMIPTLNTSCLNEKCRRYCDCIRGIFLIAFVMFIMTYNQYGKFYIFSEGMHKTVVLTYVLEDMTVTLINVLSIFLINICYGKKVQIFLKTLVQLETFIVDQKTLSRNERSFKRKFFFGNFVILGVIVVSGYQWLVELGWGIYKFFLLKDFQNYNVFITFWLLAQYANLIGCRMKDLNEHLKHYVCYKNRVSLEPQIEIPKYVKSVNLKKISEAYTTIAELMRSYNTIFGPIYIVMNMNLVMNILVPLNITLINAKGISAMQNVDEDSAGALISLCIFYFGYISCLGSMMFSACNSCELEAGKVPELCYELLKQIGDNDFKLRDELERYAKQAKRMKPGFSAAGFFSINYGLPIPVVGSLITYIIVLQHFH